jgi:exodeoxyribonuclease VII large subunit
LDRLVAQPLPGEQLILLGRIHVHAQRGQYQLIVWQSLPAGEGLRALRYRQLRQRLADEGLFDPLRKRPLPHHPRTIAVVTSPQAAAWGDIQRTLQHRYPGLHVLFSPALVQGDQAPLSIVNAIQRVERDRQAEVLILARGGGATEDMVCFNDERVVRAIAECSIPVISGIGHQRDESLADLVADVYAHTPTAAAELAVPKLSDLSTQHRDRQFALQLAMSQYLQSVDDRLQHLRQRLAHLKLDSTVHQETRALSWLRQRLQQATQQRFQQASQYCQLLWQTLNTLAPQAVLQRGYAVVQQPSGDLVRSTAQVIPGQTLNIQLHQGQIQVQVTQILDTDARLNRAQEVTL